MKTTRLPFVMMLMTAVTLLGCSEAPADPPAAVVAPAAPTETAAPTAPVGELPQGIVAERPAGEPRSAKNPAGTYVEITDGAHKGRFMVAYTAKWKSIVGKEVAMKFEPIPGGEFVMGSPEGEEGREKDEGPQVKIAVQPMWIGKYETTWDQFDPFIELYRPIKDGELKQKITDDNRADAVSVPTPIWEQEAIPVINSMGRADGFPASHMSQFNARQYTKWMSRSTGEFYRIPTESEWEYATRAGTTTAFFWGDDADKMDEYGWYFENSEWEDPDKGHPDLGAGYRKVGEKKANPWGLHDVYGNVAEWCIDQHVADQYAKVKAKGEPVAAADAIAWPTEYYGRVLRGGHWDADAVGCRSATRWKCTVEWKELDPQLPKSIWYFTEFWFGFRPVRPLYAPDAAVKAKFWKADIEDWREVLADNKQAKLLVEQGDGDTK